MIRFDLARRRLHRLSAAGVSLAAIAAGSGFYDQAHLAQEFRQLAGCAPTGWLAEEFAFLQATGPGPGEDRGHE